MDMHWRTGLLPRYSLEHRAACGSPTEAVEISVSKIQSVAASDKFFPIGQAHYPFLGFGGLQTIILPK
jgi:hypothetical protein